MKPRYIMAALLLMTLGACSHQKFIPGTRIPDESRNREIIKIIERYRHAVITKDISSLEAMAHPDYYEHAGTPTAKDDYGYKGLVQVLRARLPEIKRIRFEIQYRKINWISKKHVEVEVYIDASFQINVKGEQRWSRFADYNKIVLRKYKDRWLIVSGM